MIHSVEQIMSMMWQVLKHLDGLQEYPGPLYLELSPTGKGGIFYSEWDGRHIAVRWIIQWEDLDMAVAELAEYL